MKKKRRLMAPPAGCQLDCHVVSPRHRHVGPITAGSPAGSPSGSVPRHGRAVLAPRRWRRWQEPGRMGERHVSRASCQLSGGGRERWGPAAAADSLAASSARALHLYVFIESFFSRAFLFQQENPDKSYLFIYLF